MRHGEHRMHMQLHKSPPACSAAQVQPRAIALHQTMRAPRADKSVPAKISSVSQLVPPVSLGQHRLSPQRGQSKHPSRGAEQWVGDPLPQSSQSQHPSRGAQPGREVVLRRARSGSCAACCWCPAARLCMGASLSTGRTSRRTRSSWMRLPCSVLSWQAPRKTSFRCWTCNALST